MLNKPSARDDADANSTLPGKMHAQLPHMIIQKPESKPIYQLGAPAGGPYDQPKAGHRPGECPHFPSNCEQVGRVELSTASTLSFEQKPQNHHTKGEETHGCQKKHAALEQILPIVPGFARIRSRFEQIPGRSTKFAKKWQCVFRKHNYSSGVVIVL